MATNEGVINVDDQQEDGVEVPREGDIEEENNAKPKLRSIVWQHFPYVKGAKKAECTHCKKVLACGTRENGTSSLLSRLVNSVKKGISRENPIGYLSVFIYSKITEIGIRS